MALAANILAAISDQFSPDKLDDVWIPWLLVCGGLAAIASAFGIVWESKGFLNKELCHRYIIFGVVIETAASLLLFSAESSVSKAQRAQIIALMKAAEPRNIRGDGFKHITDAIGKFHDIKYDLTIPPITSAGLMAPLLEPGSYLVGQVITALRLGGWQIVSMEGSVPKTQLPAEYAANVLDLEKLSVPGGKTVFVPPIIVGQMLAVSGARISANMLDNPSLIEPVLTLSKALEDVGIRNEPVLERTDVGMTPHVVHVIIGTKS
jgi:hypothetical protein